MSSDSYDVAVIGAGLAGCATAALLGRTGLHIALIERAPDLRAYKTACTHFIQPSATPAIRRLGLAPLIEAAGGVRNSVQLWTRYGWVRPAGAELPYGYSLRRERLDPMLRALAADTPGVDLLLGHAATGVTEDRGQVRGLRARRADGQEVVIRARLVVAADGRASRMAALAGVPARLRRNRRLAYWAYYRDLPLATGETAQFWFLDPEIAYALPNDSGLTLVATWPLAEELAAFKADPDEAVRRRFSRLAGGPRLGDGVRESPWLGKLDMPNIARRPVHRGMALVGDAALASDPVWGVGCGWALQSAEWLADAVAPALASANERALAHALARYRCRHWRELRAHHLMVCDYSTGRRFRAAERLMFAAAAADPQSARHLHAFASRLIPVRQFLSPTALGRASLVVHRTANRPRRAQRLV